MGYRYLSQSTSNSSVESYLASYPCEVCYRYIKMSHDFYVSYFILYSSNFNSVLCMNISGR